MWKQAVIFSAAMLGGSVLSPALADVPTSATAKTPLQVYRLDTYRNQIGSGAGENLSNKAHVGFVNESEMTIDKVVLELAAPLCVQSWTKRSCSVRKQDVAVSGSFEPGRNVDQWLSEPVLGPCTYLVGLVIHFENGGVVTVSSQDVSRYMTAQAKSGSCPMAPTPNLYMGPEVTPGYAYGSNNGKGP